MSFDRGFIKWQPFNSVASSSQIFNNINKSKKYLKPTLMSDAEEALSKRILEAFYQQNKVQIYFFEADKIKRIDTFIKKLNSYNNTIELGNNKILFFYQIIKII